MFDPKLNTDSGDAAGQNTCDNQTYAARSVSTLSTGEAEGHQPPEHHIGRADRFADPLIESIVETWRLRQDMVRAQSKLTLQAKAICRRYCSDKSPIDMTDAEKKRARGAADKLYDAIVKEADHPLAVDAGLAVMPLLTAQAPLVEARKSFEKQLAKLGKALPIAHEAERIKGMSTETLAKIVAELGDLSAYEKGVAGVWKRAGLAVIHGERQRKKSNADEAEMHGYSPQRRSTFWNIAESLLKAQGKDENAGPYRQVYDARKAFELANGLSKGHAHNRAMRYMTKRLLKDLWREWKRVA